MATPFSSCGFVPRKSLKKLLSKTPSFKWWEGLDFTTTSREGTARLSSRLGMESSCLDPPFLRDNWVLNSNNILFFKNIANFEKVTKVVIIVEKPLPLKYFTFILLQVAILPTLEVPQIFTKIFFSHNIFCVFHQQVWMILRYRPPKTSYTRNCKCVHRYTFTFTFFWSTNFGVKNCFER